MIAAAAICRKIIIGGNPDDGGQRRKSAWGGTESAWFVSVPKTDLYRVLPGKLIDALIYVDGEPRAAVGRPLSYLSRSPDSALIVSFFLLRTLRADRAPERG